MKHLARLTLVFTIAFAILFLGPPFLGQSFVPYDLMKNGDVLDLLTPLVLIPLYWLLFQIKPDSKPKRDEMIAFLVLAALWVEGQGMHLVGNSIGHLTGSLEGSDIQKLTHFYDEVLSHYMWHAGILGMAALLIYRQWNNPFTKKEHAGLGYEIAAGILHGFTYFLVIVEGATTPIGVPFAVLAFLFLLIWGRKKLRQQPLLAFFFVAFLVAMLFFLGWGIYWGGLPEFSEVGIL